MPVQRVTDSKKLTQLVDYLEKFWIKVFWPNRIASQLEGSKIFTKKLCQKYNIPTAKFGVFQNKIKADNYLVKSKYPIVIKADNIYGISNSLKLYIFNS